MPEQEIVSVGRVMQDPDVINVQKAIRDILVALRVNAVYLEL